MKRLNLLLHVTSSAGWWGAVAAFLALAMAGDARGMVLTGWGALVPLAALSSLTGLIQSLGGAWGLVRHWWVVFKIVLTLPCTALLLLHLMVLDRAGARAAGQMTVDAVLALVVLMVPLALSVYKPRGVTPWASHAASRKADAPRAPK